MKEYKELKYIQSKLDLIESISDYHYVIGFEDKEIKSDVIDITSSDLFYLLNNGDPLLNIFPLNLTTSFHYYFVNTLSVLIEKELNEGIMYQNWGENEIEECFNRYIPYIKDWFKNNIKRINDIEIEDKNGNIEKINTNSLNDAIYVKIFHKTI